MATGDLAAALDEIRERHDRGTRGCGPLPGTPQDVPRLLAALDEVLNLHQSRQIYGMVESFNGSPLCAHGPDYDGDRHFEGDDGIWYCKDNPTTKVCVSCIDGPGGDLWADWPCPTVQAITRALMPIRSAG